jgi:ribosomal protein S18 acetylase RimI-like enzyme
MRRASRRPLAGIVPAMSIDRPPVLSGRPPPPSELTPSDVRWLMWHEACSHGLVGREIRNLGDAVLLHDPTDGEPFWNRLVGLDWPRPAGAFDRRLTEALALFAGLDRIPHVWPIPGYDGPPDLIDRLLSHGFEDHGGGMLMVLDADRAPEGLRDDRRADGFGRDATADPHVTVERLHRVNGPAAEEAAQGIAAVLMSSFNVEPVRRVAIELEAIQGLTDDAYHAILVRVDGKPAAVARRTTFSGASYLSSIGTDPEFRGRGLGRLVTATAVADAVVEGSRWIHLGVFEDNAVAQRLYRSLGFEPVGGVAPDLLLRP